MELPPLKTKEKEKKKRKETKEKKETKEGHQTSGSALFVTSCSILPTLPIFDTSIKHTKSNARIVKNNLST